ncbi:MAG: GDSL-type esterase/lipase family protein [Acidobacteriota bacterium]
MVRRTRWWQALLMIAASLSLVFVILELAARTYSWHLGKGFWARPHAFESAFFTTYDWPPPLIDGDLGTFRAGQTVSMTKPPGELRVICLGGSTTVNARNRGGLTYSLELQAALRDRLGDGVVVLNAGADAFSTAHSLANLSLRLLDFEPDVVTVLHNINDLTARHFGDDLEPDYSNKYLDDAFLSYHHRGGFGGAVFRFSRSAQMLKWRVTVLRRALERTSRGAGVRDPARGPRLFERNLRSILAVARAHGARPILMTQAHRRPEAEAEGGTFVHYNDITRRLGRSSQTPVVDLAAALSGREDLFLDDVHFTGEGVRAVAAELTPTVADELQDKPEPGGSSDPADAPTPTSAPEKPPMTTISLADRWRATLELAGLDDPNFEAFRELEALYREDHRTYHNLRHIADCFEQLEWAVEAGHADGVDRAALGLAIFFHDAVYSTIKGGNEQKSADLAGRHLAALGAAPDLVAAVDRLILATTHDAEPGGPDEALMIDIDLSILGRDRAAYEVYEDAIRKEYRLIPGPLFRSKRKEILGLFLERPRLFHTDAFHDRYDAAARENLSRAISRL